MIPDRRYPHPGTEAPIRAYLCIECSLKNYVKGVWNEPTGRWLMAFNCENCDCHQEAFVSKPKAKQLKLETENPDET
jgi:hypothetical protein